ncbi:hypothetical protein, partial [Bacillus sp. WP8]|uniref:hypothetical protein n=1 Tax=Bacillus sp. WP8 TaxID=756828 RepID=UPI0021B4F092
MKHPHKQPLFLYYPIHQLHYSPSQLLHLYQSPTPFKPFLFPLITYKLDMLQKQPN